MLRRSGSAVKETALRAPTGTGIIVMVRRGANVSILNQNDTVGGGGPDGPGSDKMLGNR